MRSTAQAQRDTVLGIILQALEGLNGEAADGVERLPGKMGPDHEIREKRQRLWEQGAKGGSAHDGVDRGRLGNG